MRQVSWFGGVVILTWMLSGCGKTDTGPTASAGNAAQAPVASATSSESATVTGQRIGGASPRPAGTGPETAVWDFLEAVRTGNDEAANKMLTPLARTKVGEKQMSLAPPGTDTARFVIGKVEMLAEDGARVAVDWTDRDYNGKSRTDQTIWMVRKETEGWRIAGMAVPIFEGEPMVLMNFEDPEDMLKKQKLVHDEIQRRAEQQAKGSLSGGAAPSVEGPVLADSGQAPAGAAQTSPATQTPAAAEAAGATNSANSAANQATAPENSLRR